MLGIYSPADWMIAGILTYTATRGAFRGLVYEVLGLASVVAGYLCAWLFFRQVAPGLIASLGSEALGTAAAFSLIFLGVTLVSHLISRIAVQVFRLNCPNLFINRLGGLGVGAGKGLFVILIALFLAGSVPVLQPYIKHTLLAEWLLSAANKIGPSLLKDPHLPEVSLDLPNTVAEPIKKQLAK